MEMKVNLTVLTPILLVPVLAPGPLVATVATTAAVSPDSLSVKSTSSDPLPPL